MTSPHPISDRVVVHVGTVTDDVRELSIPKLHIVALRFTESARARIQKAGGKCSTFDELVQTNPTGKDTNLIPRNWSYASERTKRQRNKETFWSSWT